MQNTNIPIPVLRHLLVEVAHTLQTHFTFRQIADLLYKAGILEMPENPYPGYDGNKYDYALKKLAAAKDLSSFLRDILPSIFGSIDIEYDTSSLVRAAEQAGFTVRTIVETITANNGDTFEVDYRVLIPPDNIEKGVEVKVKQKTHLPESTAYPAEINKLLSQLNQAISLECYDAAALLIRRIIFLASVMFSEKNSFAPELLNSSGDFKELSKVINIVSTHSPDISQHLQRRVQATKWMGDYANHNRKWSATKEEIEINLVSLRAFLYALY